MMDCKWVFGYGKIDVLLLKLNSWKQTLPMINQFPLQIHQRYITIIYDQIMQPQSCFGLNIYTNRGALLKF